MVSVLDTKGKEILDSLIFHNLNLRLDFNFHIVHVQYVRVEYRIVSLGFNFRKQVNLRK